MPHKFVACWLLRVGLIVFAASSSIPDPKAVEAVAVAQESGGSIVSQVMAEFKRSAYSKRQRLLRRRRPAPRSAPPQITKKKHPQLPPPGTTHHRTATYISTASTDCPSSPQPPPFTNGAYKTYFDSFGIKKLIRMPSGLAVNSNGWAYYSDRANKPGWIATKLPAANYPKLPVDWEINSGTSHDPSLPTSISWKVSTSRGGTVQISYLSSYTPEWGSVDVSLIMYGHRATFWYGGTKKLGSIDSREQAGAKISVAKDATFFLAGVEAGDYLLKLTLVSGDKFKVIAFATC